MTTLRSPGCWRGWRERVGPAGSVRRAEVSETGRAGYRTVRQALDVTVAGARDASGLAEASGSGARGGTQLLVRTGGLDRRSRSRAAVRWRRGTSEPTTAVCSAREGEERARRDRR